ncbi:hypothetical protein OEW28_08200 [Defluviimonas sp. WL0002]|uniref:Uncharacterized protein n=1 Tax=Albidovulum marisflavi TaxID=2984159 RepID=A0ABT2ZBZ8_9RHOB|nr:hypothetical protein [Defluviimonas sp. WL0002]MCV2868608.1 hypothetical protein [Defluviimonas sp. WL0002]
MDLSKADPKGLVRESYAIEGITLGECRSIFLDWALSIASDTDAREAMRVLIATYAFANDGHPMNGVLEAGLMESPKAARRGGRMARMAARS